MRGKVLLEREWSVADTDTGITMHSEWMELLGERRWWPSRGQLSVGLRRRSQWSTGGVSGAQEESVEHRRSQ
ncbi:hypothetical protein NHX12_016440 [Muraenolepis orangiensis]|uniref:Uncharacterized protein n=1 Tax=Muraenolepis orangiensis TaxID=630683 RepID=A0A9Q0D7R9_9TELE|nr:hypothetical protein NHX12_016440 [Muraenolepis orangiensis]